MQHRLVRRVLGPGLAFVASLVLVASILMRGALDGYVTHAAQAPAAVALTFDDGLNRDYTEAIADVLDQHGVRGTFFVVGQTLGPQRALAERLVLGGHLLANHSYSHPHPSTMDVRYAELARAQEAFAATIGRCPRFFRPPWGQETAFMKAAVRRAGMQTVMWDVEVADWDERNPQRLAERVLERVRPGSVILLHDGREGTPGADRSVQLAALPLVLDGLASRGLKPVTLGELLGGSGYLETCR